MADLVRGRACDTVLVDTVQHAQPFVDFDDACKGVLEYLQERFGLGLWMVTRTVGDEWIVLRASDADGGYGISSGAVFRWSDSLCSRMVAGEGPPAAPDAMAVPAYAQAPIATVLPVGAYLGVPIELPDGELFGTLCAVDPSPTDHDLAHELPAVRMYARLLSTILARELETQHEARRAQQAEDEATHDALTGLVNRRGWDLALTDEEARCRRYGAPAAVLSIDVDGLKEINDADGHGAGDELLRRAAAVLRSAVRQHDTVARLGGDEFGVLLPECPGGEAVQLAARVRERLVVAGVTASVGCATRPPGDGGLLAAYERADERMYKAKRSRG